MGYLVAVGSLWNQLSDSIEVLLRIKPAIALSTVWNELCDNIYYFEWILW